MGCVFVPKGLRLWPQLFRDAHVVGHEGLQKTLHCLRASFYDARTHRLVRNFVRSCTVCQCKTDHLYPASLLQPLPMPANVWSNIAMDFVEDFPWVIGKSIILTIVDHFSKMAHFIALSPPTLTVYRSGLLRQHSAAPWLLVLYCQRPRHGLQKPLFGGTDQAGQHQAPAQLSLSLTDGWPI